jgi:tRNA G37 N-methylase TrmD
MDRKTKTEVERILFTSDEKKCREALDVLLECTDVPAKILSTHHNIVVVWRSDEAWKTTHDTYAEILKKRLGYSTQKKVGKNLLKNLKAIK